MTNYCSSLDLIDGDTSNILTSSYSSKNWWCYRHSFNYWCYYKK